VNLTKTTSLGLTLLVLTGCEGWEDFELDPYMPTVSFQRVDVLAVDWEGVDADFVFDVENPNPVDVGMARFDYALAFEDVEWLSGDDPDGLVLTAEGASELALPVSLEYAELWGMVQAVRGQDDIDFGLDGSFGFDTPIGPLDIPYDERGGFPAPRRPEISLKKVKLKDLSLQGASFDVKLDVDNDHGSNLFFQNLDYELSLAGVDVGGGFIDDWGTVEGANQQTLSIPVEVSFAQAGTALYQVLQGEQLKVDIAGDVDVDTPFGIVPLEFDRSKRVSLER
jgi:LEA14-like dessication related protein